jgi:hypothetical protein
MRFIPRPVHGVLDYVSAIGLFALPRLMNWSQTTTTILTILAAGTLLYSLLTRYELGLFRILPMKAHLGLDFLSGLFLCLLPWMFKMPQDATVILMGIGLFEIIVSALSQSDSLETHQPPHDGNRDGTRPIREVRS